jgi:hypothetical protein
MKCPKCEIEMVRESISPIEVISLYFATDMYNPVIKHYCAERGAGGTLTCNVAFLEFERS